MVDVEPRLTDIDGLERTPHVAIFNFAILK